VRGEHGEERSTEIVYEPLAQGGGRVLVGERRADVTLCGRPTLVGAREIDPATLTLARASSVQNLSPAERAAAPKIKASRDQHAGARSEARLLRATAASSAVEKRLAEITDGDPATAWSENKPGDGRGEFVSMSSADEVPIRGIELVVRPTEDVPEGAAPKRFYLATPDQVFEVTMPEDAWRQAAGTRYAIALPAEVRASCLAVVLDEAYATKPAARVTIAEIEARTAFDGLSPESLAAALGAGGDRGKGAAALLARAGEAGTKATIAAYEKLDEAGRQLAAGVIDAAPCKAQAPFFAARFAALSGEPGKRAPAPGEADPELNHARDRLRRCGRSAALALAKVVVEGAPRARLAAADELAALAPDVAVPAILDAMAGADEAARRDLRAALARAAKSTRALAALADEVTEAKLGKRGETLAVDFFRAAAPSLGKVDGAAAAFAALAAKSTSFRARYLLQAPAAELSRAGDPLAQAYLRDALLKDQDAHVRARAAEVAAGVSVLASDLVAATGDPDPRVREAAVNAFVSAPLPATATALATRLASDEWTFVRAAAARALGALPAEARVDQALAAALGDRASEVRARALDGLAAHRAAAHLDAIRERQDDDAEDADVRARAILALGALCDARSVNAWTKLALAARQPMDERDRRLGTAAIAALGDAHPADLAERLAPLLARDAPGPLREMAKAALGAASSCKR
jgi:HEAT repeat protein